MYVKGQVSAEFLIILSALLFLFLIFYVVYVGQTFNLLQSDEMLIAMRHAYGLSAAINYVHLAGDGAVYAFTISGKRPQENITLSDAAAESSLTGTVAQAPLLNSDVNVTEINKTDITITKRKGVIEIG